MGWGGVGAGGRARPLMPVKRGPRLFAQYIMTTLLKNRPLADPGTPGTKSWYSTGYAQVRNNSSLGLFLNRGCDMLGICPVPRISIPAVASAARVKSRLNCTRVPRTPVQSRVWGRAVHVRSESCPRRAPLGQLPGPCSPPHLRPPPCPSCRPPLAVLPPPLRPRCCLGRHLLPSRGAATARPEGCWLRYSAPCLRWSSRVACTLIARPPKPMQGGV